MQSSQIPNANGDVPATSPPGDSFSCLAWGSETLLAAGSWDKSVRLWDVQPLGGDSVTVQPRLSFQQEAPVLSCCFSGGQLLTAGCDCKVSARDLQAQRDMVLGRHEAPVKEVAAIDELGLVVSGSWDKTLRFWSSKQQAPVHSISLPERVYTMDVKYPLLLVGTANRHVLTYDLAAIQQSKEPLHQAFSQLKMQTRCVSLWPDRKGYVIGSIEGRCGVSVFGQENNTSKETFTFKCHRADNAVYSVNVVDFHPKHGSFATAGSDGSFNFWDKEARQRLKNFSSCGYPITAGRFSPEGGCFAYAVSYDWSQAQSAWREDLPREVFVHRCPDSQVQRRNRN